MTICNELNTEESQIFTDFTLCAHPGTDQPWQNLTGKQHLTGSSLQWPEAAYFHQGGKSQSSSKAFLKYQFCQRLLECVFPL